MPGRVTATEGDGQFLITWVDNRIQSSTSAAGSIGARLAMRVDLSGRALDAHPFKAVPQNEGVVWTGNEWIAYGSWAGRISRDGRIVGESVRLWEDGGWWNIDTGVPSAAWVGGALVVARNLSDGRIVVRTFDRQLQLIAEETLMSGASHGLLGVVTDGTTALVVYRDDFFSTGPTFGAVFGGDGHRVRSFTFPRGARFEYVAGSPAGYAVLGIDPVGPRIFRGHIVDAEGTVKTSIDPIAPFPDQIWPLNTGWRRLFWDGKSFVFLHYGADKNAVLHLGVSRIGNNGKVLTEAIRDQDRRSGTSPAIAVVGTTLVMAEVATEVARAADPLDVRVAPDVSSLLAVQRTPPPPGAQPRETPAAAASASQVLVAWRQRSSAIGPLNVYATRLRPDGEVVDGQATVLGAGSCPAVPPAVATDGRDFLVAWTTDASIAAATVRADGTGRPAVFWPRLGECTNNTVGVASNGAQYLVVWAAPDHNNLLRVFGARVASDGTRIDRMPLQLGSPAILQAKTLSVKVASNGSDYLVVWENSAVRVNAVTGTVIDTKPLSLGTGEARAVWFNGRTYVVVLSVPPRYRFFRIGADGSGAATWNDAPRFEWQPTGKWSVDAPVCGPSACFTVWGTNVLSLEDRGDSFAMRQYTTDVDARAHGTIVVVAGTRLLAIYSRSVDAAPYATASDTFVQVAGAGKRRAAHH